MSKTMTIRMNGYEEELLENVCRAFNLNRSQAVKMALKHLGNDHLHQEPASGRVAPELMIEVPAEVRLRSMIMSLVDECKKEVVEQRSGEERNRRFGAWILGERQ